MLIVTAKLPRRKLTVWALTAAALGCCVLLLNITGLRSPHAPARTAAAHANRSLKTEQDRLELLRTYGWEVQTTPPVIEELLLPETFDADMEEYLLLQQQQGFDLSKLAGKRIKRYSYAVTNYPTGQPNVQVNLLLRKDVLVGGEVVCPELDGFIHSLQRPESANP